MKQSLTLVEENYLKAIYHLSQNGELEVATNALAEEMHTTPASASDMIKRLSKKEVVRYQKYKGVNVSEEGKLIALKVIRKHRLWEVFLVEKLGFNWDEVHEVAEQLEHIKSPLLTRRLDEFLGFPKYDPHGDPIPDEQGQFTETQKETLNKWPAGSSGTVVAVHNSEMAFLKYLDKAGIHIGTKISIDEVIEFDGSIDITIDQKKSITVSKTVAENIWMA